MDHNDDTPVSIGIWMSVPWNIAGIAVQVRKYVGKPGELGMFVLSPSGDWVKVEPGATVEPTLMVYDHECAMSLPQILTNGAFDSAIATLEPLITEQLRPLLERAIAGG